MDFGFSCPIVQSLSLNPKFGDNILGVPESQDETRKLKRLNFLLSNSTWSEDWESVAWEALNKRVGNELEELGLEFNYGRSATQSLGFISPSSSAGSMIFNSRNTLKKLHLYRAACRTQRNSNAQDVYLISRTRKSFPQ